MCIRFDSYEPLKRVTAGWRNWRVSQSKLMPSGWMYGQDNKCWATSIACSSKRPNLKLYWSPELAAPRKGITESGLYFYRFPKGRDPTRREGLTPLQHSNPVVGRCLIFPPGYVCTPHRQTDGRLLVLADSAVITDLFFYKYGDAVSIAKTGAYSFVNMWIRNPWDIDWAFYSAITTEKQRRFAKSRYHLMDQDAVMRLAGGK